MNDSIRLMLAVCRGVGSVALVFMGAAEYFGRGDHVAAALFVIAATITTWGPKS